MSKQPNRQLVRLIAEAEAARLVLEALILRGIEGEQLTRAIDTRASALEALSEHYSPTRDDLWMPKADRHVPHQRRNKKNDNAA